MKPYRLLAALLPLITFSAFADIRELIPEATLKQIAEETSGEAAKRNLDTITLQHRMRASSQFELATQHILERLEAYGLDEIGVVEFEADGKTMYGTQKSRPVWDVQFAQLWEVEDQNGDIVRVRKLGDWDSVPLTLAQDSLSGDVTTSLVDIGAGSSDADFEGKDLKGKLVLTSSQPGAVVERAVGELGAAGIISYAPNQKSAWWKEDDRLVRWGHLSSFPKTRSFGFMISLGEARNLQQRLESGETILFHAKVEASHKRGKYRFATAAITGTDKSSEDINFTCHLDHPRPGANDNASGCVSILEVARTLNALIDDGILPRPSRSIRFLWPAEIEGSIMYLSEHDSPSSIKANIHMDMVGGAPVTKAVFRISGGPYSVPSFVSDLGHEIGHFINDQTKRYADGEKVTFPLVAPEGGKEPQLAQMEGLDMGSDHDVFFEGTWRIPGLYLHDWPDRYIHTNFDLAANIDPTKLKRAAFIGAVTGWYLANLSDGDVPAVLSMLERNALKRSAALMERRSELSAVDAAAVTDVHFAVERRKVHSVEPFASMSDGDHEAAVEFLDNLQALVAAEEVASDAKRNATVYERNPAVKGPMHGFGYSYEEDHYGEEISELGLENHTTPYGDGGMFIYEALNLVDGKRSVSDIRDWLLAELGEVPLEHVVEYLKALESIEVIRNVSEGSQ
jgi:aminopeptidase YwaD